MKAIKLTTVLFALFLGLLSAGQTYSDIIVFRTGNYQICTILEVDAKHVQIKTEYGDQKIARNQLMDFYQAELGKPGMDFFRAGELYTRYNMAAKAQELFNKAVELDPSLTESANRVLAGGSSNALGTGTGTTDTGTVLSTPGVTELAKCPVCGGEGQLQRDRTTGAGTTITSTVPCWFCDSKGLKKIVTPHGKRKCPECGGWGYKQGTADKKDSKKSSSSSNSTTAFKSSAGNVERRESCWRCRGLGYIDKPMAEKTITSLVNTGGLMTASDSGNVGYSTGATSTMPGDTGGMGSHPGSGSGSMGSGGGVYGGPAYTPGRTTNRNQREGSERIEDDEDEDKEDDEKDEDEDEEDEKGWFQNNLKLVMILGGGALLIVLLVLNQSSKK